MANVPSLRLQQATALALQALAVLLLGLHLHVYLFLPPSPPNTVPDQGSVETAWWGLWPIHYLPSWWVVVGAVLVLGLIAVTWLSSSRRGAPPADSQRLLLPLVTVALFAAFYLFPLAHTRWGDAYMLAHGIAYPDAALRLTHSWQAPLDVFLHAQTWQLLHGPLGWEDAMPAYRLLSPIAGLLYLLTALGLSRDLDRHGLAPAWLSYSLLATLGLLQLFFGYVENYAFAAALVLAYLRLALRTLLDRRPLWHAATVLALANATHPSTIILAPSLLFLGWRTWRRDRQPGSLRQTGNQSLSACVLEIALPVVLIGGATFAWMEASGHGLGALLNTDRPGGGDASWFVPLRETTTRWERYTMFSWPHVRDWLNQQLLVAPIVLPALAVVAANRAACAWLARRGRVTAAHSDVQSAGPPADGVRRQEGAPAIVAFLLIAAGFCQLFIFAWNPDYGGQRDWDLFSLAALPAALLLAVLLPKALPDKRLLRAGVIPLLVLQGWHTAAWIYQNTLPWQWPD